MFLARLRKFARNYQAAGVGVTESQVRLAFTPCLQYTYARGKNTSDIALALDALEALFDHRADTFCLVTSDSDFSYLCRKLRERGATVYIVGEHKTPDALRNASDQFFEWTRPELSAEPIAEAVKAGAPAKPEPPKPVPERRPRIIIEAVTLLAGDAPEGKVNLSALGSYLRRADPAFSRKTHGHSGLLDMVRTYDLLVVRQEEGNHSAGNGFNEAPIRPFYPRPMVTLAYTSPMWVDNPEEWIGCLLLRCASIFTSRDCTIAFGRDSQLSSVHPPGRVPTIRGIFKRHWPTNPAPLTGFVFSFPACGPAVHGTSSIGFRARAGQGFGFPHRRCGCESAQLLLRVFPVAGRSSTPRRSEVRAILQRRSDSHAPERIVSPHRLAAGGIKGALEWD